MLHEYIRGPNHGLQQKAEQILKRRMSKTKPAKGG